MSLRILAALLAVALCAPTARAYTVEPRGFPAEPFIVLPWWNGLISSIGQNFACLTSPPILEVRTQAYAGYTLRPPNLTPAVGEVFYVHLVMSHPGNPCTGSAVGLELILPPGVQTATSANDPAFCFAVLPASQSNPAPRLHNLGLDPDYGCPQFFPPGLEGLRISAPNGGFGGGSWGMHRGFFLEILIPLVSTIPHPGTHPVRFRVNPDVGVVGYPATPVLLVNNDVIFRSSQEDVLLTLDVCGTTPTPLGC